MKAILTIIILLFCLSGYSQKVKGSAKKSTVLCDTVKQGNIDLFLSKPRPSIVWSNSLYYEMVDSSSETTDKFRSFLTREDTLFLIDTGIKFIKINDEVYEVKRIASIEPVMPKRTYSLPDEIPLRLDTSAIRPFPFRK